MTRSDALWLAGIVVGGGGIFAVICVRNLRGMPRDLVVRLFLSIAVYLLLGGSGIAFLIYLPSPAHTSEAAIGVVIAMIGWLGLAVRALGFMLPSAFWPEPKRPKPQWMERFGILDVLFLLAAVGGSAMAAGFI
jgi:hypothetical protein